MFKDLEYDYKIIKDNFPNLSNLYERKDSFEELKDYIYEELCNYEHNKCLNLNKFFEDFDFYNTIEYRNLLRAYESHISKKKCSTCGNLVNSTCRLTYCPKLSLISDTAVDNINDDFKNLKIESEEFQNCFLSALYEFCIRNKDTEVLIYSDSYDEYIIFYINLIMKSYKYSEDYEDKKIIINPKSISFLFPPQKGAFVSGNRIYITDMKKWRDANI